MSLISSLFTTARSQNRRILIAYIVAGDPCPDLTPKFMHALVAGGSDIIELGIPFSDPEAEGDDIQAGCARALQQPLNLSSVLEIVRVFRRDNKATPVVLMGYFNSIENVGIKAFSEQLAAVAVDGVIIVNMPPEEGTDVQAELRSREIDTIYLIAPNTADARATDIALKSSGFVYCVALQGTTGSTKLALDEVQTRIVHLRTLTAMPLAVGFGIRDGKTAQAIAKQADAVVIGSALVKTIGKMVDQPEQINMHLKQQILEIRNSIDRIDHAKNF